MSTCRLCPWVGISHTAFSNLISLLGDLTRSLQRKREVVGNNKVVRSTVSVNCNIQYGRRPDLMSGAPDPLQGSVKGPSQSVPNPRSWFLLRNPPNCPGDLIVIMQPVTRTRGQAPALTCLWCFSIYTPWTIHSDTMTNR